MSIAELLAIVSKGGKIVWENRKEIRQLLTELKKHWMRQRILIIGPGGVGKTTLARILSGETDWLVDPLWKYQQSIAVETKTLKKDHSVELVIYPGEKHRLASNWQQLLQDISSSKYKGIVYVSAYGYRSIPALSWKTIQGERKKSDAIVHAFEQHRQQELSIFQEKLTAAKGNAKKLWILSLVTKQDLWFDIHSEVEHHYLHGPYAQILADLEIGSAAHLRHEIQLACLVIANLKTLDKVVLQKTCAGYDHEHQVESIQRTLDVLLQLISWEAAK